ncbi:MAG: HD domain-containing protein [Phycisphaerae bacterium]|nr:HD-GYP domain-containing protein [Phycisphaerae bacterium]NIP52086.1 HD-GYP domain-containing protein [Phycisphaerae bacterium]NIS50051.1 HD-GYP domain-containing protein [Phycisphaerae bacterium]NIU10306.1 HD-GYP domain-containing protein [Phycisphaerae bacterium]NIU55317.1 HD domain-containing protein [Phycisphaerae bacterium]
MQDTGYEIRLSSDKAGSSLTNSQLNELESFGARINNLGVNFAVCNADGELVLLCEGTKFKSDKRTVIDNCTSVLEKEIKDQQTVVIDNRFLAAVLKKADQPLLVALIDLGDNSSLGMKDKNLDTQQDIRTTLLNEMLGLLARQFQSTVEAEEHIEMVGTELARVYEELVLLHKLSINMRVTEPDANFLQMACDNITDIVSVEGIAILLEKTIDNEKQLVVAAGSGLIDIDQRMAAILHSRLTEEINSGKEALLDSEVDSPFKYDWPDSIKNIIAVPLCGKDKAESYLHKINRLQSGSRIIGLMIAINRVGKQDFDSTDAQLFNSVANGCAVFIENGRLFNDLKTLFIGALKALTRSIDAKDQYTRGHSERVAFISRWIAERLAEEEPLEEEQIHRIYLAGLLHDIGKIGIDEAVLRKKGKLTDKEYEYIRKHPSIGAGILREIKQMHDIVPGVLYHHERIDGKGYPGGFAGDQIPLIGKIVGLADGFDAMTSKRTYRDARSVEEALEEIRKGSGTQFDERVAGVFLNSDVYRLWDIIIQNGPDFIGIYGSGNFSEYGIAAVGTLIG